jgi:DNA replication protein DnaC
MIKKDCRECDGTGWKPIESDGVRYVVACNCRHTERTLQLQERARIPQRYEHCAFENFSKRKQQETGQLNQTIEAARLIARRFVEEYPTDYGLLFVGPTGVGKTHLAVAVLRELISKGVECLFYDFRDLLKTIQDSYNSVSQTSELRILQPVLDVEVLLLDEMAPLSPSDWVKETLAYIINSRYNQKKITLITTTIPRDASRGREQVLEPSGESIPDFERTLGQLGATLLSRLYEMCKLVEMSSDDFRKAIMRAGYR